MTIEDPQLLRERHLARALLLPTPFATTEAEKEPQRRQTILDWLRLEESEHRDLHEACARDAHGMHIDAPGSGGGASVDLRHPLSGQTVETPLPSSKWDDWFTDARESLSFEAPGDFERLWFNLSHADCVRGVPADADYNDHTWLAHRSSAAALLRARWSGDEATLLFVHYGPVQSFIEASRRTSDLWLGSFLISDLAYTAAQTVATLVGPHALVYPHLASVPRYQHDQHLHQDLEVRLRPCVPNRFVAIVPSSEIESVADALAKGIAQRWREMADAVREWLEPHCDSAGFEGFDGQIADHPVIDIVAQPWATDPGAVSALLHAVGGSPKRTLRNAGEGYPGLFSHGRSTLAGLRRVSARGLRPGDARVKCSQCGLREAMGLTGRAAQRSWWASVRAVVDKPGARPSEGDVADDQKETIALRRNETLCAVCLTRRFADRCFLAGKFEANWNDPAERVAFRFPSVASIAVAPFRHRVSHHAPDETVARWHRAVSRAHELMDFSMPGNQVRGLGEVGRGTPLLEPDGTWLYPASYDLDTCLRDHDDPSVELDKRKELAQALEDGASALAALSGTFAPSAYFAVVVLDVDDMGAWLDGSHDCFPKAPNGDGKRTVSAALHTEVSRRQGVLATTVLPEVIEKHLGQLVYSGGDDVLAFLPLASVWSCLSALRKEFTDAKGLGDQVTLSAGVAVGHWKTPLQGVLKRARDAEARAKRPSSGKGKDAVEVSLATRSGMPTSVRLQWPHLDMLQIQVNRLAKLESDASADDSKEESLPTLLRPTGLETLRAELSTLRLLENIEPLKHRVEKLTKLKGFAPLEQVIEDGGETMPERLIDLLALVRFVVREHRGIAYGCPSAGSDDA